MISDINFFKKIAWCQKSPFSVKPENLLKEHTDMQVGEIYLCKLTGKKYEIAITWGRGNASNIDDPKDVIYIYASDIANGYFTLYVANCGNYHYWRKELNFQFEAEYCYRCGIKKPK